MKLLFVLLLLLLIFPLISTAAAFRWVDENGNVRFGSKPQSEQSEPAAKIEPKAPAKKSDKPIRTNTIPDKVRWVDENGNVRFGSKPQSEQSEPTAKIEPKAPAKKSDKPIRTNTIPDKVLPTVVPVAVPETRRGENPPISTQRPQHAKPATGTRPVDREEKSKPAPAPKVVEIKPAPIPAQRTRKKISQSPITKPATKKATAKKKPAPQKKKKKAVKTAPKAGKEISQSPVTKPAIKKATAEKVPKPESVKPVLQAVPALTPAPVPKAEIKPAPIPDQRAGQPPASQPVKSAHKPAPQKKKEKVVKTAPKAGKNISQSPVTKPATPATEARTDKNAELCGMFTNYVSDYQNKLIGCQGASCTAYKRSLVKYQKKQKTYCGKKGGKKGTLPFGWTW